MYKYKETNRDLNIGILPIRKLILSTFKELFRSSYIFKYTATRTRYNKGVNEEIKMVIGYNY